MSVESLQASVAEYQAAVEARIAAEAVYAQALEVARLANDAEQQALQRLNQETWSLKQAAIDAATAKVGTATKPAI